MMEKSSTEITNIEKPEKTQKSLELANPVSLGLLSRSGFDFAATSTPETFAAFLRRH